MEATSAGKQATRWAISQRPEPEHAPHLDTSARPPSAGLDPELLTRAVERGVQFLRSRQLPTGAWIASEYFEPQTSACHLITLAFLDRLPWVEARAYARFLATLQDEDGSFPAYPCAPHGDPVATALVLAALDTAQSDSIALVRARARAYLESHGGLGAVREKLARTGDATAIYLAMAGLIDPFDLPEPDLSFMLAPPLLEAMLKKINAGVIATIIFSSAVTRLLRERKKPSPAHVRALHEIEAARCADFIESWQNPNGNYCGTTAQTDMIIAALFALGRSPESRCVYSALCWFNKHRAWDERGLHLQAFTNENWMTAWSIRALLYAGVERDDPAIGDALDYLCWSQSKLPMPQVNLRRRNAHRSGAWGFQEDNLMLVDMDDTGIVLSALGLARRRDCSATLDAARAQRVQDAVDLGLHNVIDMQCDDGGWAGFVWNLGSKQAGPLFDKPVSVPATRAERLRLLADPPLELAEPAVEGLTGRVLQGLAANGFGRESVEVQRAAQFLRERQCADGSWWERWIVGYLAATASVVSGLAACDWDMEEPWLRRAVEYLLSKQNMDGGWGETPAAYERPQDAIASPSMPPLTAVVLVALVDVGLGHHPAAGRGACYLLSTQNEDGSWPTNGWLQIYLPYQSYYLFEGEAWYRPIEALGKLRSFCTRAQSRVRSDALEGHTNLMSGSHVSGELAAPRLVPERWLPSALRRARAIGDTDADTMVDELVRGKARQDVSELLSAVMRDGQALPEPIRHHFEARERLPEWADTQLIRAAQRLFTRHGWLMSVGLFCSSLPQAYCAANGARVLTQTQGMTRHARNRILETAHFLFEICSEGSFDEQRLGIRAAQRVRVVHALIRKLLSSRGDWSQDELGVPINQEDLAGTLMTFSVVLLDALETAGVEVPPSDQEAFLHLWKVTGHFLGLAPALLPVDVADARALMQAIRTDQWAPSAQGRLLAAELVSTMRDYLPTKLLGDLPPVLIRFFAPAPVPRLLGLEATGGVDRMLEAGLRIGSTLGVGVHEEGRRKLVRRLSRDLMIGIINAQRADQRPFFRVPSALAGVWKLR